MKKVINTPEAPAAVGPYNQGNIAGKTLYASGQIAIDPKTNKLVEGGIKEQTEQVLKNIGAILDASGYRFYDVVKTTVFITDMNDFGIVNEIYAKHFNTDAPARSCVAVQALPKGALIEIEAIAYREDEYTPAQIEVRGKN